jgi:hypothetical protein
MKCSDVLDLYFMEARARVLDLAAFLDRVDRAGREDDFRLRALEKALATVMDGRPERARRVLELWSDPSAEPVPAAPGKGAAGAWPGL